MVDVLEPADSEDVGGKVRPIHAQQRALASRARNAHLPQHIRNAIRATERVREATEVLRQGYGPTAAAELLGPRWGCAVTTANDYIRAAVQVMANGYDAVPPSEHRARLLAMAESNYRDAKEDRDHKAAGSALEFQARLLGLPETADARAQSKLLALAKAALTPQAYGDLVLALARDSGDPAVVLAELPSGSGVQEAELEPRKPAK